MMTQVLEPTIALEILISEALFRRVQKALDANASLSVDDLANRAIEAYLRQGDHGMAPSNHKAA